MCNRRKSAKIFICYRFLNSRLLRLNAARGFSTRFSQVGPTKVFSYRKLVRDMNDGTSPKSVRQIRQTEYPEYNLGNTRTSQINNIFGFTCEAS